MHRGQWNWRAALGASLQEACAPHHRELAGCSQGHGSGQVETHHHLIDPNCTRPSLNSCSSEQARRKRRASSRRLTQRRSPLWLTIGAAAVCPLPYIAFIWNFAVDALQFDESNMLSFLPHNTWAGFWSQYDERRFPALRCSHWASSGSRWRTRKTPYGPFRWGGTWCSSASRQMSLSDPAPSSVSTNLVDSPRICADPLNPPPDLRHGRALPPDAQEAPRQTRTATS